MKLAIRNDNGKIYFDKEYDREYDYEYYDEPDENNGNLDDIPIQREPHIIKKRLFTDEELTQPPYNYTIIEIDDQYADCEPSDFNQDLTLNVEKYNARHAKQEQDDYIEKVVALIRKRYTMNDELAILRQRDAKPTEFDEYNAYVEECKAEAKKRRL